ncbi:response regulator [Pararhodospirillum photometricum]|nr:response regulator transcription factor [Pararhodospirillum photometricum]
MTCVLIVDDDSDIRDLVAFEARRQGWEVCEAASVRALEEVLARHVPDLILLDIRLPDGDGLALAQRLRASSEIPIIMLTGLGSDIDRVVGLEIGADDYVVKPFNPRELIARIKAVLRRSGGLRSIVADDHDRRRFAGWVLDLSARTLQAPDGRPVHLTCAEFQLLEVFAASPRRVLSRDQLLERTRSDEADVFDRTIDVLILRLRRKIESNPQAPTLIRTERGVGYVFDVEVTRG